MRVGYVKSNDLLVQLVREVHQAKSFDSLPEYLREVLEEVSWHLFRKKFKDLTESALQNPGLN